MHTAAHSLVTAVLTLTLCAAVGLFVPQALKVFDPGFRAAGFLTGSGAGKWAAVVGTNVGIWWVAYAAVLSFVKWVVPLPGSLSGGKAERSGAIALLADGHTRSLRHFWRVVVMRVAFLQ